MKLQPENNPFASVWQLDPDRVEPFILKVIALVAWNPEPEACTELNGAPGFGCTLSDAVEKSLRELCAEQELPGCAVECAIAGPAGLLLPGIADKIYLIAQEAVVNAERHGHASSIQLSLSINRERLVLDVVDNGHGGPLPSTEERRHQKRYGLNIMEQLAFALGARLSLGPNASGPGWRVQLHLDSPLQGEVH